MGLITDTAEDYYEGETGGYRYISLKDIVNNFMVAYVGDGKDIDRVNRGDVIFHAKRGIQEFSYDISRVEKIQEVEVVSSLSVPMPQDFVGLVNISWIDNQGIEHLLYEARHTSKPSQAPLQDQDGNYIYDNNGELTEGSSITDFRYKQFNARELNNNRDLDYFAVNDFETVNGHFGQRYGISPEHAQTNGYYIIDEANGKISFSSNIVDKIVNIKYVSDGLGTDAEMKVHKFIEEALYMHIAYKVLSTKLSTPEYKINRYDKKRKVAMRKAKMRLSKLNLRELTQTLKGLSKRLKH